MKTKEGGRKEGRRKKGRKRKEALLRIFSTEGISAFGGSEKAEMGQLKSHWVQWEAPSRGWGGRL